MRYWCFNLSGFCMEFGAVSFLLWKSCCHCSVPSKFIFPSRFYYSHYLFSRCCLCVWSGGVIGILFAFFGLRDLYVFPIWVLWDRSWILWEKWLDSISYFWELLECQICLLRWEYIKPLQFWLKHILVYVFWFTGSCNM